MKTTKSLLLTLALALTGTFAFAQISSSAHDFSAASWNSGTDEICITCHTPHNALSTSGPLWNHAESTVATYGLYTATTSSTFDATASQPSATSKLCLSCHDGTVDLGAYGATADTGGGTRMGTVNSAANLGIDLSSHHPVSFTYDNALYVADGGGLYDPDVTTSVSNLLFGGKVECASCHDPHNAGFNNLLVMSNSGSALCLTCHNK